MAVTQVYTAQSGDTITADRWNNEFGNIIDNGTDVAFPLTKAVSFAGFTITWDASGNTTMVSSGSAGFAFTPGNKTGTPSTTGGLFNSAAATFTDNATAGSGTATSWAGWAIQRPTLAATNATVTTTDAATLHIAGGPTAGTNETLTNSWALRIADSDARTATVDVPMVIESVTSDTPAAGIGTGLRFRAESQDENPCEIGQVEFALSDVTTGSEDTYLQVLLRVAGAALTSCYRFAATGAFNAIFTHANTAARTYTLPNASGTVMSYVTGAQGTMDPFNDDSTTTTAHGLPATPSFCVAYLECLSTDLGYAAGDRVFLSSPLSQGASDQGIQFYADATNTYITCGLGLDQIDKSSFNRAASDETKWKVIIIPIL